MLHSNCYTESRNRVTLAGLIAVIITCTVQLLLAKIDQAVVILVQGALLSHKVLPKDLWFFPYFSLDSLTNIPIPDDESITKNNHHICKIPNAFPFRRWFKFESPDGPIPPLLAFLQHFFGRSLCFAERDSTFFKPRVLQESVSRAEVLNFRARAHGTTATVCSRVNSSTEMVFYGSWEFGKGSSHRFIGINVMAGYLAIALRRSNGGGRYFGAKNQPWSESCRESVSGFSW